MIGLLFGLACWIAAGVMLWVLINQRSEAEDRRAEAEARAAAANLAVRVMRSSVQEAVIPLAWAWNGHGPDAINLGPPRGEPSDRSTRLRFELTQALVSLKESLGADDAEMAELMAGVPDPPRRLPRYPQVPPFLASPEDVAKVPPPQGDDVYPEWT